MCGESRGRRPAVTEDYLLAVTFGGLILGVGVGIILRHGGCLDGTEISALNKNPDAPPKDILTNVGKAVDDFVNGAEQFDDLTMMCIEYKG